SSAYVAPTAAGTKLGQFNIGRFEEIVKQGLNGGGLSVIDTPGSPPAAGPPLYRAAQPPGRGGGQAPPAPPPPPFPHPPPASPTPTPGPRRAWRPTTATRRSPSSGRPVPTPAATSASRRPAGR